MKRIILLVLAMVFMSSVACAGGTFTWTPVTLNTDGTPATLSGYNIYDTTATRTKINTTIIPISVCTPPCTWVYSTTIPEAEKFVCTAVGTNGNESGDSNTATYGKTPNLPGSFQVK